MSWQPPDTQNVPPETIDQILADLADRVGRRDPDRAILVAQQRKDVWKHRLDQRVVVVIPLADQVDGSQPDV